MKFFITLFLVFCSIVFANFTKQEADELFLISISEKATLEDVTRAQQVFGELEKENPSFYYQIRLATLLALQAKHSSFFKRKGLADNAIEAFEALGPYAKQTKSPEELYEFHFFRGRTYSNFPSFMGKASVASTDLETAVRMVQNHLVVRAKPEVARLFVSYGKVLINEGNKHEGIKFLETAYNSKLLEGEDLEFAKQYL